MPEEKIKIIEKIDELIEEGEKYKKNYAFLEFALWKNKVEFLLKVFGGSNYVNIFFNCFESTESESHEELNKQNLGEENSIQPGALFQIIVMNHKRDMQRVLNLLSSLKIHIQESEGKEAVAGKKDLKVCFEVESEVSSF
jgi:hypothetical protein